MENLTSCPVCKTNNFYTLLTCKDYVATEELFTIGECKNCTHRFTNPRPYESEIGKYYQSEKYISHAAADKSELGVTYKLYDQIRNYSISHKLRLIKKYHTTGKLLDLGCGLGYFLNGVKNDRTFDGVGADISNDAILFVKKTFGIDVMSEELLNGLKSNSFDIITQWHVLEHIHRLDERMQELKKLLAQNGTMFIAVPNSKSLDASYYKEFWDGYDVPRHLHHFNPESFSILMKKHGFKIIKQKAMLFDAPYISMRSEYHKKHTLGFIKGGILGLVSNIKACITGNYSSILFIVKHL
ncbi:MAG: class I SAM-dependent methyltransferase [Bacteroidia bacterium]|nr:class I SAM-dependent methyltransferase [Bacteroidia bacterium]